MDTKEPELMQKSIEIDMERIRKELCEQELLPGAYCQEYEIFKVIYRFMARRLRRTKEDCYIILMTLTDRKGELPCLKTVSYTHLIFGIIAGNIGIAPRLTAQAFTSGPAMIFFVISGFFALFAYSLWYKGNSMCGAALGMACNGAFSFWGPFFCWIILGVICGIDGWSLPPIVWAAAILMIFGILMIAMNPLDLFRKKED